MIEGKENWEKYLENFPNITRPAALIFFVQSFVSHTEPIKIKTVEGLDPIIHKILLTYLSQGLINPEEKIVLNKVF